MAKIKNTLTSVANSGLKLSDSIELPGDKSISHRSMIFGGIANGVTKVSGFLESEDCIATKNAMQSMGVEITKEKSTYYINGVGLYGLKSPKNKIIDCGNAGTGMRLLAGLLAGQRFSSTLTGDKSLNSRPMSRVMNPLKLMGANISATEQNTAPLKFHDRDNQLTSIHYDSPIASAQVKSCVLIAGLYAQGVTSVNEPKLSRDHTENMLQGFGCDVAKNGLTVSIKGQSELTATEIIVPADISSAAFFMVLGVLSKNSELLLKDVCINPSRVGVIEILKRMNGNIEVLNSRNVAGEQIADILVKSSELKGIEIPIDLIPSAIDEFPILFIAAALSKGTTKLTNAKELRVKESDRISVMATGLKSLGIDCEELEDGITIHGGEMNSAVIDSHGDHRCAMSFLIAGQFSKGNITVQNCEAISTSFPNFLDICENLGVKIENS